MASPVDDRAVPERVWIQVVTTQPVVASGIEALLQGRRDARLITTDGPLDAEPDVVFYDVIGLHEGDGSDLDHWVAHTSSIVVAVARDLRPDLAAEAFARGAIAAISLGATAEDFLEVIEAALTGHIADSRVAQDAEESSRLGLEAGLTHREADVIGLIVRGRSNREIGEEMFLSTNTVKGYIRSAYRKMEVASRSQAVTWGLQHGFPLASPGDPTGSVASRPSRS